MMWFLKQGEDLVLADEIVVHDVHQGVVVNDAVDGGLGSHVLVVVKDGAPFLGDSVHFVLPSQEGHLFHDRWLQHLLAWENPPRDGVGGVVLGVGGQVVVVVDDEVSQNVVVVLVVVRRVERLVDGLDVGNQGLDLGFRNQELQLTTRAEMSWMELGLPHNSMDLFGDCLNTPCVNNSISPKAAELESPQRPFGNSSQSWVLVTYEYFLFFQKIGLTVSLVLVGFNDFLHGKVSSDFSFSSAIKCRSSKIMTEDFSKFMVLQSVLKVFWDGDLRPGGSSLEGGVGESTTSTPGDIDELRVVVVHSVHSVVQVLDTLTGLWNEEFERESRLGVCILVGFLKLMTDSHGDLI
ncbi:hypothetical protein WICPIJ_007413 [Wickerhamomyces pijperi]|uniref:Uncharacterized protein n=1 Tax=Wickerhamomyces pijperi TaxID=599730 RepID=A0A9P8Q0A6_WICPI|nr:hypothetical protein WICPIJ_007413 [Wickerhamomyces pijperi]